ncbi:hypothetical protein JXB31_05280 [Candidatus Woesearchaeota archaeon]|nr:hypothetical protein [Candidatus Woesearchaeota archaeon]
MIELGGNIELVGFREVDGGSMIIIKKIVGNYARQFSDKSKDFKKLTLSLKKVHEREKSEKYELHAKMVADKDHNSEVTDRNLLIAVDKVLKKIQNSAGLE